MSRTYCQWCGAVLLEGQEVFCSAHCRRRVWAVKNGAFVSEPNPHGRHKRLADAMLPQLPTNATETTPQVLLPPMPECSPQPPTTPTGGSAS